MFEGKMDGEAYVWLATLILSVYGASNVAEKRSMRGRGGGGAGFYEGGPW